MTNPLDAPKKDDRRLASEPADDRSPLALALEWSSRTTAISLELVLPTLIGYWLDQRLGSLPVFLILGLILGFVTATLSLVRLTKPPRAAPPHD